MLNKNALEEFPSQHIQVLIVEDDEQTGMMLRAAISGWGYDVMEASNGEEAWVILNQTHPPMLLVLDWLMPKLTGIELCEKIRKELNFYPYIIFLTRVSGTQNIIRGLETGADEFLLKPIDLPELRIRLFAGERIIKCLAVISNKDNQLRHLEDRIKTLENLLQDKKQR